MNRRTFIKTTGIGVVSLLGPSFLFAGEKEQEWIRLPDQRPKVGQNIVVLYEYKKVREICCGRVSKSEKDHLFIDFSSENRILNKKLACLGSNFTYEDDCRGVGFSFVNDSVSWIPMKKQIPNKLPKYRAENNYV